MGSRGPTSAQLRTKASHMYISTLMVPWRVGLSLSPTIGLVFLERGHTFRTLTINGYLNPQTKLHALHLEILCNRRATHIRPELDKVPIW